MYQNFPVLCDKLVLSPSCCYFVLPLTATPAHSSAFHKIRVHIWNGNLSFHATCPMYAYMQCFCIIVPMTAQLPFSRNHDSDRSLNCWKHKEEAKYRGADKSLARPERKQAKATEDFEFHIHSFSILSDDRSKASPKTIPPYSAI